MKEKIAVVDVGEGLRGIYGAGILDYCLKEKIEFDLGIGSSVGSANLASYIARQSGRNVQIYAECVMKKRYMGMENFIKTKSYIDLNYIYGTLMHSDGAYPLDYKRFRESRTELLVAVTDARTGKVRYFDKDDIKQNQYDVFKASSAIPFVCMPHIVDSIPYYDGSLSDPVPVKKAFESGCDKVVLILTMPKDKDRKTGKDAFFASRIKKKYPLAAEALLKRAENYNKSVALAKEYEEQGRLIILAPDVAYGGSTLSMETSELCLLYEKGYEDAAKIKEFVTF